MGGGVVRRGPIFLVLVCVICGFSPAIVQIRGSSPGDHLWLNELVVELSQVLSSFLPRERP